MARLNLDDDNVFVSSMPLDIARECVGAFEYDECDTAMDEAQGHVFNGNGAAYLVIKIEPDEIGKATEPAEEINDDETL